MVKYFNTVSIPGVEDKSFACFHKTNFKMFSFLFFFLIIFNNISFFFKNICVIVILTWIFCHKE